MNTALKVGLALALGGGAAVTIWMLTRSKAPAPAPATPPATGRVNALRGYTQGPGFRGGPNLLSPLASAGLQQEIFRRHAPV
jgi:hypothetical protein